MAWRFRVATLPSFTWVDKDVELVDARVSTGVNAPASVSGRVPLGSDVGRYLREWGALIVAQDGNAEPVSAIVDHVSVEGDWLVVEAGGFSMVPNGQPWVWEGFSGTEVDPLNIVRWTWYWLQQQPAGDVRVEVDGLSSRARLGKPASAAWSAADSRVKAAEAAVKTGQAATVKLAKDAEAARVACLASAGRPTAGKILNGTGKPGGDNRSWRNLWFDKSSSNKPYVWDIPKKAWVALGGNTANMIILLGRWQGQVTALADAKKALTASRKTLSAAKEALSKVSDQKAEPWSVQWWDAPDCGQLIAEMLKEAGAEYREITTLSGDTVKHRLALSLAEIGARRPDLVFEIGLNVTAQPPLDDRDFASEVTVLGAGEGRKMIRATVSGNPGRLRRSVVVQRKDIRATQAASAAARAELPLRRAGWDFSTLEVAPHEAAPAGSFRAGDTIRVTGDAGWEQLDRWVRVMEIETNCESGHMTLKVVMA